jgi:hypothetical protein
MKYENSILEAAHKHSSCHKEEILKSNNCGCFFCLIILKPEQIAEWIDDEKTALCPDCGVDSVIGDASGYPVEDKDFLLEMHGMWFC